MNRIEVIGLSGKSGSGKDYLGKMVLRRAGYHQWAFAWPLKTQLFGRENAHPYRKQDSRIGYSYGEIFHHKDPAVRRALQVVGTEEGRDLYGINYWTEQASAWLRTLHENLGLSKFYFTDCRFPNEVEFIQRMGGKVIRLEHGDRIYPLQDTKNALHSSETALDDYKGWDFVFENNLSATPYHFRLALEEAGILPRWDNELEAVGGSADRMDSRFDRFFEHAIPGTFGYDASAERRKAEASYDVPPVPFELALEEAKRGQG